ncbi:hypothetical protein PsYK624_075650 [Phanerochaete sordida]|uniref:Uncharacterized protein n=1 Tax=Phanerochaete sordida TaxID=48140 RepID=A0A9P3GB68_9APHY|nr:hypothetical protein PsYK624_075650 [Phanerochaete sordida]
MLGDRLAPLGLAGSFSPVMGAMTGWPWEEMPLCARAAVTLRYSTQPQYEVVRHDLAQKSGHGSTRYARSCAGRFCLAQHAEAPYGARHCPRRAFAHCVRRALGASS